MTHMKADMGGGAAVLATVAACRDLDAAGAGAGLRPAHRQHDRRGRPAGRRRHHALRRQHTEVLNTDAEGR